MHILTDRARGSLRARPWFWLTCLLLFWVSSGANAQVIISEFMASNGQTLLDEDGDSSDWIEIYNGGSPTVNLFNWSLTDDPAQLTEWRFPSVNLPAKGFLLVFASGKNRALAGAQLHTNFKLDAAGSYLALVKPDGVTIAS